MCITIVCLQVDDDDYTCHALSDCLLHLRRRGIILVCSTKKKITHAHDDTIHIITAQKPASDSVSFQRHEFPKPARSLLSDHPHFPSTALSIPSRKTKTPHPNAQTAAPPSHWAYPKMLPSPAEQDLTSFSLPLIRLNAQQNDPAPLVSQLAPGKQQSTYSKVRGLAGETHGVGRKLVFGLRLVGDLEAWRGGIA